MSEQRPQDVWQIDNLPNRLTLFRILLIPIIVGSLMLLATNWPWVDEYRNFFSYLAAWTFVGAAITDFVDGYVARKRDIVTVFGSFLDPIADKFLVVSSLVLLQGLNRIPAIVVLILILREFYITSLRLLANDQGIKVPVSELGKWKTAFQMIAIPFLIAFDNPWGILPMPLLGNICIYIAAFLSLYSALQYTIGLIRKINELKKSRGKNA